jgi:Putative zinc-finger
MTHLEVENLASDYLEGLIEGARLGKVEEHLTACAACREMIGDLRETLEACQSAEDPPAPSWLIQKILLATVGQRKPTWRERAAAYVRPVLHPRFAYAVAMAVFSFSIIVNAAGLNLRNLNLRDLNPMTWVARANAAGHMLYGRVERFYYDLRVVYEIQSRFRQPASQGQQPGAQPAKPAAHPGGTTNVGPPETVKFALVQALVSAPSGGGEPERRTLP